LDQLHLRQHRHHRKKFSAGQATVEYILLLSIVVLGSVFLIKGIVTSLDDAVTVVGGKLEKQLKTGRDPISVWRN